MAHDEQQARQTAFLRRLHYVKVPHNDDGEWKPWYRKEEETTKDYSKWPLFS